MCLETVRNMYTFLTNSNSCDSKLPCIAFHTNNKKDLKDLLLDETNLNFECQDIACFRIQEQCNNRQGTSDKLSCCILDMDFEVWFQRIELVQLCQAVECQRSKLFANYMLDCQEAILLNSTFLAQAI